MLSILAEKIHDNRFLRLIANMLKAGYLGGYSFIAFSDFSAPKLLRSPQRKVIHNSTGKDERFLRMTGNLGHGNGPSF